MVGEAAQYGMDFRDVASRERNSSGPGFQQRPELFAAPQMQSHLEQSESNRSMAGDEMTELMNQTSIAHLYSKQTFKKIVKRMKEDSSSIWYDFQELELLEYAELCENYKKLEAKHANDALTVK